MAGTMDHDFRTTHPNRPSYAKVLGNISASIVLGGALWTVILSVPLLMMGKNPITVAQATFGVPPPIDDPLILARDSELRLIEPASGPAHECD